MFPFSFLCLCLPSGDAKYCPVLLKLLSLFIKSITRLIWIRSPHVKPIYSVL